MLLDTTNFGRAWSLLALSDFKRNLVSLTKIIEGNANEVLRVEEEIFIIALNSDEAEASISNASDYSFLHMQVFGSANSSGNGWRKARSSLLWISAV